MCVYWHILMLFCFGVVVFWGVFCGVGGEGLIGVFLPTKPMQTVPKPFIFILNFIEYIEEKKIRFNLGFKNYLGSKIAFWFAEVHKISQVSFLAVEDHYLIVYQ